MTAITVKRISETELEAVAALEQEIFSDAWSKKGLEESLCQSHALLFGAWSGDILAGYLIVYCSPGEGEIVRIATSASMRRQGVAGRLLLELENVCEEKGIEKLFLEVRESNVTAIEFYKSHGFTEDGLRKNFYEKPVEDAVLMSRELGK